ncbi:hypothetical protein BCR42DRAFT_425868 [Absidia repens]|uniref:Uncharacterized protein n=1 Tax=Absidia repens TaxID=90262 RepID=A0A1X2I1W7_9FUNG|nr:hypothetical protein BCR42DRAFT_425868 [Absidia repens]
MQPQLLDKDHYGKIAERLRIRLDLASFKCKYGYENVDLYTMESFFPATATTFNKSSTLSATGRHSIKRRPIMNQQQQHQQQQQQHHHRYYPTHQDNRRKEPCSKTSSLLSPNFNSKTTHHHQQPSSSPPLSAKRSTSPSRTDELTARLLLWMCHQKRTTDSA